MSDLYLDPVSYGVNDVTIPAATGGFGARIYYPSLEGTVRDVAIRPGKYPLVAFAHGDRVGVESLCPADVTLDHRRWTAVWHQLAKCGYVVISVQVFDVVNSPTQTASRLEAAVAWIRREWTHRAALFTPPVNALAETIAQRVPVGSASPSPARRRPFPPTQQFEGNPTPLAVVGHSWGARAAAIMADRRTVPVAAIGSIAGTWDDNESIVALGRAARPTLMLAGSDDLLNASALRALWSGLTAPKHQALLQGVGHFGWLTGPEAIRPCDGSRPTCPLGFRTAGELLLGFVRRHLSRQWQHPPYLLGPVGTRTPLIPSFGTRGPCALKVRWEDPVAPLAPEHLPAIGERTFGTWTAGDRW